MSMSIVAIFFLSHVALAFTPMETVRFAAHDSPHFCQTIRSEKTRKSPAITDERAAELFTACRTLPAPAEDALLQKMLEAWSDNPKAADGSLLEIMDSACASECANIGQHLTGTGKKIISGDELKKFLTRKRFPSLFSLRSEIELIRSGEKHGFWQISRDSNDELQAIEKGLRAATEKLSRVDEKQSTVFINFAQEIESAKPLRSRLNKVAENLRIL